MEHVESLDPPPARPTAHERLERLLGKYLASLLLTALASRRPRAADVD